MNNLKFKGYGFKPSDQVLIGYLRDRTLFGRDYLVQDIIDLGHDICNNEPWDLPSCDSVTPSDSERFFIYPKTYKYPNSNPKNNDSATGNGPDGKRKPMINRTTNNGKWKVSGERTKVRDSDSNEVIGIKTKLYFKQNSCPTKTSCVLYQFELTDIDPCQNIYFLGKLMMKEFNPTNISSSKGETGQQLHSNYLGNDHISIPEVQVDFHQEPLVEIEAPNDYEWIQNQTSISEQTNEFITPFPVFNYENFVNDGNDVISNLQPSNHVADYAIPQIDYMELIRSLEVPDIGDQKQLYSNQYDQSFQNILIDNDQTNPEERSNQHNIVAENEGFNLPSNLYNNLTDCTSQMNCSEFWNDGLYFHELFEESQALNNYDGAQNQYGINQQVADERDKSAAGAEIEGSNLTSLGVTESSHPTELVGKRSAIELEGSSIGIETKLTQPQTKKSRL